LYQYFYQFAMYDTTVQKFGVGIYFFLNQKFDLKYSKDSNIVK